MKTTRKEFYYAKRIIKTEGTVIGAENLLKNKDTFVSFNGDGTCILKNADGVNASIIIDIGREISGCVRLITRNIKHGKAKVRLVFGESVSEAMSVIGGKKNATNDHSPRDFEAMISSLSTLDYGKTGYRFVKIELLGDGAEISLKNVVGICELPDIDRIGYIKTSDERLNEIVETAFYTCQLNMQDGLILDGIKRDRLVWSGDLFSEILTILYTFGDTENIPNALTFLRETSGKDTWINGIPSYNAWWLLNLCTYCKFTGKKDFFDENYDYVKFIVDEFDACVAENGDMDFKLTGKKCGMEFFLDWPTETTPDEVPGTALLLIYALDSVRALGYDSELTAKCERICESLNRYVYTESDAKQVVALQVLCGNKNPELKKKLEKGGARGVSTFMSYFILKALDTLGSDKVFDIAKEYYGAMLDRGATTFWEDFNMDWLDGSGRIDEIPKEGEKDLHGDYGAFCYIGFRHSFCHGWSSGVYPFTVEKLLGLDVKANAYEKIALDPSEGEIKAVDARIPTPYGNIEVSESGIKTPDKVKVIG